MASRDSSNSRTAPERAGTEPTAVASTLAGAEGPGRVEPDPAGPARNPPDAGDPGSTGLFPRRAEDHQGEEPTVPIITVKVPGFEVKEVIGSGGMGIIFRARQISLDRDVALKFLPPAFAADPVRLQRFRNEAEIAAKLDDSRILEIHDVREVDGAPVLVMPFIDGWDLGRILEARKEVLSGGSAEGRHSSGAMAEGGYREFILPVLDEIIGAVAVIHSAGILHRDIKPSNVLVDRQGHVKLSDFGLARLGPEGRLTLPGRALGTIGYMSPEQSLGAAGIDARADLFSLGVTIYHALTLAMPYGKAAVSLTSRPPRSPSALAAWLSRDFDAVILKALEPDRNRRYPSVAAFQSDWLRVRAGLDPVVRPSRWPRRLVRQVRLNRRAGVSGLTFALVALALALWFQTASSRALVPADQLAGTGRVVKVLTTPPGARFVLVGLDETTGDPRPDRVFRPRPTERTPGRLRVPPGDYLVEVEWPDRNFHEVRRHVPRESGEISYLNRHRRWKLVSGEIVLPAVFKPPGAVLDGMAYLAGSDRFVMPAGLDRAASARPRRVLPFYLDTTEVTVARWRTVMMRDDVPINLPKRFPPTAGPDEAIRFVEWDWAVPIAEMMGKRLPTETEFRFAATNGGTTNYPWGDDHSPVLESSWPVGPVRLAAYDRTRGPSPIFGLFSNVVEWTSNYTSTFGAVPGSRKDLPPFTVFDAEPVCHAFGGPASLALGKFDAQRVSHGLNARELYRRNHPYPGIGFRGARSAGPRFLGPAYAAGTAQAR